MRQYSRLASQTVYRASHRNRASGGTCPVQLAATYLCAAEYCAPVWTRSPNTKLVDDKLRESMTTLGGCSNQRRSSGFLL
ncbi:hypothetical protein ElyMa_006183000 [Elysia marginata]|uniref:Uncharacterized protein n=1 Tax=Elysia marginata TaxID=1093978 RepID=A0AAV4H2H2_9GAST|nr:hypothetical protein ElyMa_006183000 [Elysia marginata]